MDFAKMARSTKQQFERHAVMNPKAENESSVMATSAIPKTIGTSER